MKMYGCIDVGELGAGIRLRQLADVTLEATPDELRRIGAFLSSPAKTMEYMGASYDHEHLSDRVGGFDGAPGFVVARASSSDA